jgi:predicted O-methyltransferase YrrM
MPDFREALSILFRGPYFLGNTRGAQSTTFQHLMMSGVVANLGSEKRSVRAVEVGSWIGFSALTWAYAIGEFCPDGGKVTCIDMWEPYFHDVDLAKPPEFVYGDMDAMSRMGLSYDLFRHNVGFAPERVPIDHVRGRSAQALAGFERGSVDLLYLDGSHYYADVKADIAASIPLLSDGGILCGDDLELQIPDVGHAEVMAAIEHDYTTHEAMRRGYHPGVTLAVHESLGRVPTLGGFWYIKRRGDGWETFDPKGGAVFLPPHFTPSMQEEAIDIIKRSHAPGP